jgi:HEAT repeat protein
MVVSKEFEQLLEQMRQCTPRDSALSALSNLHGPELEMLADSWMSLPVEHRRSVVASLFRMSEADFEMDFVEVFKICLRDAEPSIRATAIEGLWETEDVVMVRPLVCLLCEDESAQVREAAAISLSRFALMAEIDRLPSRLSELVWDCLWKTVHNPHENVDVRRRAVESLAYFDRPEVAPVIARAYQDSDSKMRVSAVFAMGRSADEKWGDTVLSELERDDDEMRYEAARASGELQLIQAIPSLSRMVADSDLEVRLVAVWALGRIGGAEAKRVLEICYEQGDEALRDAAEEALAELDFAQDAVEFPLYDLAPSDEDDETLFEEDEGEIDAD